MDVALLMVAVVAAAHWHKLLSKNKFSIILAISCVASTKLVLQTDCCMFSYVTKPCQILELTVTHSGL